MKNLADKSPVPWQRLLWSFEVLEGGIMPFTDMNGAAVDPHGLLSAGLPIANDGAKNYTCALLFAKGDLEFFCVDVGLPNWGSHECCALCMANKTDKNFKDMRRRAQWRRSILDQRQFAARFHKVGIHPLLDRMCIVAFWFWAIDLLHVTDYHGVSCHCIGNVINDIIKDNELTVRSQDKAYERPLTSNGIGTEGERLYPTCSASEGCERECGWFARG